MSLSEARRQIAAAEALADIYGWNNTQSIPVGEQQLGQVMRLMAHGFSALVEAIAENKPYDGSLEAIKIPNTLLRSIILDAERAGVEEMGLETLILTIRGRLRNSALDE